MGRRRKPGTEWMPPRVYVGKSAYEFRPKSGGTIRLCPLTASQRTVVRRFDEEFRKLELRAGSFGHLVDQFFVSPAFHDLSPRTRVDYKRYSKTVLPVFGRVAAGSIKPEHIRRYMDMRGQQAKVQANREHSFMSKVFSWGYERGLVAINPCLKVRKFTEEHRDRYITDEEYAAVLRYAPPLLQAAMEISYCCAARQGDVLSLEVGQLLDDGIFIKQGKTNKAQIKAWSPRLRRAIALATSTGPRNLRYVLSDDRGHPVTGHQLRRWYKKAKDDAAAAHPGMRFDFTFHDIKAKSISDWEGDKQRFSGHKTAQMVQAYDRKVEVVGTHE